MIRTLRRFTEYGAPFLGVTCSRTTSFRATKAKPSRKSCAGSLCANVEGSPYCLASGFSATDLYVTKFSVWLDEAWRRERLPKVEALTAAVRADPRSRRSGQDTFASELAG